MGARARGLSYKEIAGELGISVNTVKTHFSRIFVKLDVQCSIEMLMLVHAEDSRAPWRRRRREA